MGTKWNRIAFCVICVFFALTGFSLQNQNVRAKPKVLLLSFDGFRWDYLDQYDTPNLDQFAAEGVHAPIGVHAAFVTKTFPNHYTIATGLYEESHGIVSNKMYDSKFQATFDNRNTEPRWWDGGEPLWNTITINGLKAGVYAWPGSAVRLSGLVPYRLAPYSKSATFQERVDVVLKWLLEDEVDIALAYFHEPDSAGHKYGAMTHKVQDAVERVDALVGILVAKMKETGLYNTTDVLIVSDHGMANVTADKDHLIVVSDYVDVEKDIEIMPDDGALANILPKEGQLETVYQKLRSAHPNMTVYKKEDIPERFHYSKHRRILPIVAVADEGYYINQTRSGYKNARPIGPGEHGYDNDLPSMRPIFLARGPHFLTGYKVPVSFETVNIYALICHILDIQPAPNNGTLSAYSGMLRNNEPNPPREFLIPFLQALLET